VSVDSERSDGKLHEWQCPPKGVPTERILGWLNENTENGLNWQRSQRGYSDWRQALDVISGNVGPQALKYRSKLNTNHLKRNIREVVGALAKLRPLWGYSSDNSAFAANAELFNKYVRAWYLETFADVKINNELVLHGAFAGVSCNW